MGKRKHPAPRGYNPGGFRFPGSGQFVRPRERFDSDAITDARGIQPIVSGHVDDGALMAATALAVVARMSGRRRRG